MSRPSPEETKLVLCVHHPFTLWRLPKELPARIKQRWPGMRVVALENYDRLAEELADADVYVGFWARSEQFRVARKLRWVHATAAGVSQLLHPEFVASDVVLTNARGVNAIPIGDHTLGVILAFSRHLPSAWRHQREHRWAQQQIWDESPRPRELAGQRLLLVGLGAEVSARDFAVRDGMFLVGAAGFEPTTPSPPDWCANRAAPRPDRNGADYRDAPIAAQPLPDGSRLPR